MLSKRSHQPAAWSGGPHTERHRVELVERAEHRGDDDADRVYVRNGEHPWCQEPRGREIGRDDREAQAAHDQPQHGPDEMDAGKAEGWGGRRRWRLRHSGTRSHSFSSLTQVERSAWGPTGAADNCVPDWRHS